jgi:hypothetical protein
MAACTLRRNDAGVRARGLHQLLGDEEVAHCDGHHDNGDIGDQNADPWQIVAQLAVSAQFAVLHLPYLYPVLQLERRSTDPVPQTGAGHGSVSYLILNLNQGLTFAWEAV